MKMKPFETDGCSGGMSATWRKMFGTPPPWEGACVKHDAKYYAGGTYRDRVKADLQLMKDVSNQGYPVWGFLMYVGVRIGGGSLLPTPWRWGYGYYYKDYIRKMFKG